MKVCIFATNCLPTALLVFLLFTVSSVGAEELPDTDDGAGRRFVAVGQLATERIGAGNRTRFVLLDESGAVLSKLRASDTTDLSRFVGQEVGVTARTLVDGDVPILLAEHVAIFGPASEPSIDGLSAVTKGQVGLVSHEEELLASRNFSVPTPATIIEGPIVHSDGIPIDYGTPMIDDGYGIGPACSGNCNGSCGDGACAACPCGPSGQFWLRSEYLLWTTNGMNTPALVTSSPAGTDKDAAGVLGEAGTQTLFGGTELFDTSRSGARFRLGKWCDQCQWIGFETEYFFLGDESSGYKNCDIGEPIIARPFFNTDRNAQDSELVQFPGVVAGKLTVDADSSFWSVSPRLRVNLACEQVCDPRIPNGSGSYRFDLLVGYRYLRLDDGIRIHESLTTVDARSGAAIPNDPDLFWDPNSQTFFDLSDSFDTTNDFHGADLGMLWEGYRGPWSLELIGRIGIGNTSQEVRINGSTRTSAAGTTFNEEGGILALGSNIGTYKRDEFAVIPEFGATLGYALSPRARFVVGYSFLHWNKVVRAGDQIDLNVNPDLVPTPVATTGPNVPAFAFNDSSFWAQGLNLGLDYRW